MPNDAKSELLEYRALLDVFEKDCGRPAATMAEVRFWAGAQNRGHLEFRVKRRLLELLFGAHLEGQQRIRSRFAPPPRGWRVLRRKPKHTPSAITSVIASMSDLCRRLLGQDLARQRRLSHRSDDAVGGRLVG